MARVSVIIPSYQRRDFLAEAIPSVLGQSFRDFELIVVDDGSTDGSRQLIEELSGDVRLRYVGQAHRGGSAARNAGITRSRGDYLAFLDSDDLWLPAKLERQVEVLDLRPEVDVVYCAARLRRVGSGASPSGPEQTLRRRSPRHPTLYEELLYENVITGSASSVMARRACVAEVGGFDESNLASDGDMWRRLALKHRFYYIDEALVILRQHGSNMGQDPAVLASAYQKRLEKLETETPDAYRHHLASVGLWLRLRYGLTALRRRQLRAGCTALLGAGAHALRHPLTAIALLPRLRR